MNTSASKERWTYVGLPLVTLYTR